MRIKNRFCLVAAAALSMAMAPAARAQEIDYGELEALFGQPVTTSVIGSPQTVSQAPADMQIISANDIRRSGATNIPDILRYVAGIDVRSYGALDSAVSVGGFSQTYNPRLLVLLNGRQVYEDDYADVAWQTIAVQLANIRQIEIVKGPESALYGFNAVSGVINIITYDPLFDKTNSLNFAMGTGGALQGSLISTFNSPGKGGVTISLGGLKPQEYSVDHATDAPAPIYTKPIMGSYDIDARYKPTANTEVTLDVTESQSNSLDFFLPLKYADSVYVTKSDKASFAIDSNYGLITLMASLNRSDVNYKFEGNPSDHAINQLEVLQLNDLFKPTDAIAARIGLEYRNSQETGQLFNGAVGTQDIAANAMWHWQIAPQFSTTIAGRIDHLTANHDDPLQAEDPFTPGDFDQAKITAPSFNLGAVYQPTLADTFRALMGRAEQEPSLLDYGLNSYFPTPEGLIVQFFGNPYLKASIATNYELDYDHSLSLIPAIFRTSAYYSQMRDFEASGSAAPASFVFTNRLFEQSIAENIGDGTSGGGSVGLKSLEGNALRWNIAYTLTLVSADLSSGPPTSGLNYHNATPESVVDFGGGYSWNKWEADLAGKWQSNYEDIRGEGNIFVPVSISNYVELSARLAYRLTSHLTLAVAGNQLQAAQTTETASLEPERQVLFSATYEF